MLLLCFLLPGLNPTARAHSNHRAKSSLGNCFSSSLQPAVGKKRLHYQRSSVKLEAIKKLVKLNISFFSTSFPELMKSPVWGVILIRIHRPSIRVAVRTKNPERTWVSMRRTGFERTGIGSVRLFHASSCASWQRPGRGCREPARQQCIRRDGPCTDWQD